VRCSQKILKNWEFNTHNRNSKALQKAEIYKFCRFAKFGTCFFLYSVCYIFHIASKSNICNITKLMKLTKRNILGPNTPVFGSKTPVPNIPYILNIRKWPIYDTRNRYKNIVYKLVLNFHEKLVPTWIPTQIFEFEFGMQGLTK